MATGHRKLLDQLTADGITRIFGNPGSTEEGLLDEINKFGEIEYVMGLQEAALLLLANGYGLATQKPTVVLLHSSVGLGNALGSLYHVHRMQRSPLMDGQRFARHVEDAYRQMWRRWCQERKAPASPLGAAGRVS